MKDDFENEKKENIRRLGLAKDLHSISNKWFIDAVNLKYSYNFSWMGRPIIQFPQDIIAIQEIIWNVKPDLIIETGIARGGSIIFHASMLELIGKNGIIIGIDKDIREHNRIEIEKNRMYKRIKMFEGSSISDSIFDKVSKYAKESKNILVVLDSNHTHEHVLKELQLYSPLVTEGSYLIVFDTVIDDMPDNFFPDRPWGKGNNPKTAVKEFLKNNDRFEIDKNIENKLLITAAPSGYLKCVKN